MNQEKLRYPVVMSDWQKEMTDRIGKQVEFLRGDMTALKLSELTERLGMKISRSALSDLENGKRKSISLAEVLVLSAALKVPPALLIWPDYPDGLTEFLPGRETPSFQAANWFGGEQVLSHDGLENISVELHGFSTPVVRLSKLRDALLEKALDLFQAGSGDANAIIDMADQQRRDLEKQIKELGGVVKDAEG